MSGRALVLCGVLVLAGCTSQASPASGEPSIEGSASRSPKAFSASPAPSQASSVSPADGWTRVGAFGDPGTIESVLDIADTPYGVLAVGVRIGIRNVPVFGPVPQEGRVWWSDDGRSWHDVTPVETFADVSLHQVVLMPDGAVVGFGSASLLKDGIPEEAFAAWETRDGRTWSDAEITLDGQPVSGVTHGGRGFVAVRRAAAGTTEREELWHSTDGRTYSRSFGLPSDSAVVSLAGGPEGFVAVVSETTGDYASTVFASGDGVEWYEAEGGLSNVGVAALGPDWVAVAPGPFEDYSVDVETPAWFSRNGLEWTKVGVIPLKAVELDETASCREFLSNAIGTGSRVVVSTTFSYPCGEGRVQTFGRSSISTDGATWTGLPFTASRVVVDGSTRGATVTSGLELDAGTLLGGEEDYRAAFWLLPAAR